MPPEPSSPTLPVGDRRPGDEGTGAGADGDVGTDMPGTETVGVGAGKVGVGAGSVGCGVGTGTVGVGAGTVGVASAGSVGVGRGAVTVGTGNGEVVIVGSSSAAADPVKASESPNPPAPSTPASATIQRRYGRRTKDIGPHPSAAEDAFHLFNSVDRVWDTARRTSPPLAHVRTGSSSLAAPVTHP